MYINSIGQFLESLIVSFFVFINKILFSKQILCLMDKNRDVSIKNRNLCPSKNLTLASQHVSYLENDWC